MPGVHDFYQGTEFWDLSLADPDNRRPVDFNGNDAAVLRRSRIGLGKTHAKTGRVSSEAGWTRSLLKTSDRPCRCGCAMATTSRWK